MNIFLVDKKTTHKQKMEAKLEGYRLVDKAHQGLLPPHAVIVNKPKPKAKPKAEKK